MLLDDYALGEVNLVDSKEIYRAIDFDLVKSVQHVLLVVLVEKSLENNCNFIVMLFDLGNSKIQIFDSLLVQQTQTVVVR